MYAPSVPLNISRFSSVSVTSVPPRPALVKCQYKSRARLIVVIPSCRPFKITKK